jgi:hypothetical protein
MCLTFPCCFLYEPCEVQSNILKTFQVSLLTDNGETKDDLRLPTDENLLKQVSVVKLEFLFEIIYIYIF